jgi:hypothetical protein
MKTLKKKTKATSGDLKIKEKRNRYFVLQLSTFANSSL